MSPKEQLDALPQTRRDGTPDERGGWVLNKWFPRARGPVAFGLRECLRFSVKASATVEDVEVRTLKVVQPTVNVEKMKKFLDEEKEVEFLQLPVVVKYAGTSYLLDGNHRAALAAMLGRPTIRARVMEVTDD